MALASLPTANSFFKPADHKDDFAILVEVTNFTRQVPTNYGPKDEVTATLFVFKTEKDLEDGNAQVLTGTRIQQSALVPALSSLIGQRVAVTLTKQPSKKPGQQDAWVWKPMSGDAYAKIAAYDEKLEAERKEALSGSDVPPWLQ